ncbi:MAG: hypothetical protein Fur0022_09520 [Anaerolineales bacterium]
MKKHLTTRHMLAWIALIIATLACARSAGPAARVANPIWEKAPQPFTFANFAQYSPVYANGLFLALDDNNTLFAWEEHTGKIVWQTPAISFRLSTDQKYLYVKRPDQTCVQLHTSNGALVGNLSNELGHLCRPDLKNDTDTLYTFTDPNLLTATRVFTGETLWQVPLNLPDEVSNSSIFPQPPEWADDLRLQNGRVLVHTTSFKLGDEQHGYFNFQAFDSQNGALVWEVVGKAHGGVIYDTDRVYLIYTDQFVDFDSFGDLTIPLQIHAHDVLTGQELWQAEWIGLNFYQLSNSMLYSCQKGNWRWLDAATGQLLGEQTLSLPAAAGGCLLMNNASTNFLQDKLAFQINHKVSKGFELEFDIRPYDTWLNVYHIETGKPLWSTEILLENNVSIAAVGQDVILLHWGDGFRAYSITP